MRPRKANRRLPQAIQTHDGLRPECKDCGRLDSKKYSRPVQSIFIQEKRCSRCASTKPSAEFYKNARHADTLSTYCKECTKSLRKDYSKDELRNFNYKSTFGITLNDYEMIFQQQNGRCAICNTAHPGNKNIKHFCVDHCHKTGRVRGLLCEKCNRGLGHFDDSVQRLASAVAYLKQFDDRSNKQHEQHHHLALSDVSRGKLGVG